MPFVPILMAASCPEAEPFCVLESVAEVCPFCVIVEAPFAS